MVISIEPVGVLLPLAERMLSRLVQNVVGKRGVNWTDYGKCPRSKIQISKSPRSSLKPARATSGSFLSVSFDVDARSEPSMMFCRPLRAGNEHCRPWRGHPVHQSSRCRPALTTSAETRFFLCSSAPREKKWARYLGRSSLRKGHATQRIPCDCNALHARP